MSPRIVPATAADFGAIQRIAHLTWPETFGSILSTQQIEYMLERMYSATALARQLEEGHVFHLVLDADQTATTPYARESATRYRPVGYVSHQVDYLPGTTKIHKLYVLPGTQGRGFGRALLKKVESIARRAGQSALRLDVNYQNRAIDFYERLGFVKLDRFDTEIGKGFLMEDWRMEKPLR